MSTLVMETDTEIYLRDYLHRDDDTRPSWLYGDNHEFKYPKYIVEAEDYALYEVKIDYVINKKSGEVTLLGVK